ncbi:MAG: phosphoribosylanthranilate isomerase [Magnetococcales bacterium]|nr:phosphoribosylanthranilate isomerase [Magnetococcales bacterium]
MVRVKICGITRLEDGLAAAAAGADAIGLVFHPPSPRAIDPERAADLVRRLPPFLGIVGLFVNRSRAEIEAITRQCRLDMIQLHGDETPADCADLPVRVIKAVRVSTAADLAGLERYPAQGLLLDARSPSGVYGGGGHRFDWSLLADYRCPAPLILAGGLDPDTVAQAVARVRPYAVDVSTGVEAAKGIKDPLRMQRFVAQARLWNRTA